MDGGDEVEGFNEILDVNDGARARALIGRALAQGGDSDDVSLTFIAFARPDTLDLILVGSRGEFARSLSGLERSETGSACG